MLYCFEKRLKTAFTLWKLIDLSFLFSLNIEFERNKVFRMFWRQLSRVKRLAESALTQLIKYLSPANLLYCFEKRLKTAFTLWKLIDLSFLFSLNIEFERNKVFRMFWRQLSRVKRLAESALTQLIKYLSPANLLYSFEKRLKTAFTLRKLIDLSFLFSLIIEFERNMVFCMFWRQISRFKILAESGRVLLSKNPGYFKWTFR